MNGMYQILDNRDQDGFGDITIIKADPKRNMVWSTYVQDVGDMGYAIEIVKILNEHRRRLETELSPAENVISETETTVRPGPPNPKDIRRRMERGESISHDERQRANFYIPPDMTTDRELLRKIGWDVTAVEPKPGEMVMDKPAGGKIELHVQSHNPTPQSDQVALERIHRSANYGRQQS